MRITPVLLSLVLSAACAGAAAAETAVPDPAVAADLARTRAELREARAELREVTRRVAALSLRLGSAEAPRAMGYRYLASPNRAMIGVVLGVDEDAVVLSAVTPGGPADKAGVRAGDRLLAVDGKAVVATGKLTPGAIVQGGDRASAARALIGELEPGTVVKLAVERAGKRHEFEIAAERRESWNWPMLAGSLAPLAEIAPLIELDIEIPEIEIPDIEVIVEEATREALHSQDAARAARDEARNARDVARAARHGADHALRRVMVFRGGELYNLRLAPLNAQLGRYFGADSGVLVLDKDATQLAALKPGDVITSIGGRRVDTTTDAMRALGDHEPGAQVNVEVVRERKRQVLVLTVPERGALDFVFPPEPPLAPTPPAAPRPAAAPRAMPAPAAAPAAAPQPPRPPRAPQPPADTMI